MNYVFALSTLIALHAGDGREVWIDPDQVTSVYKAKDQLTPNVKCVINLTDGKFISVAEECEIVLEKAKAARGE
jgi:uncharacterized protein YlzI (FlbEa/FlbD family)